MRWTLLFAGLLLALLSALWWSASAVHFTASRVEADTPATYRVHGVVRDARTGAPIPFARIEDHPDGRAPLFHAVADVRGEFELATLAEPHQIVVTGLGYKAVIRSVGKPWYLWLPRGVERVNVLLEPE